MSFGSRVDSKFPTALFVTVVAIVAVLLFMAFGTRLGVIESSPFDGMKTATGEVITAITPTPNLPN